MQKKRTRFTCLPQIVELDEFTTLEICHPYGLLPQGNRFFDGDNDSTNVNKNDNNSQSPDQLLTDECWVSVLNFCDAESLGSIVQTCRFFYVTGHQPELWRDLMLRQLEHGVINSAGPTWKDAYVRKFHARFYNHPHQPIQVTGVYADNLFRLHSCRSFAIPSSWLDANNCTVTRTPASQMTTERFINSFEVPNNPVLIEGASKDWQAFKKWNNTEYCLKHTQGRSFRATSGVAPLPAQFTFSSYLEYAASTQLEEAPLYLFDRTALSPGSPLWLDYMPDLQRTCPYWDPAFSAENGHDLLQVLGEGRRPDHTWLIVGPRRSGSVFHIDPNATHAWNAAIVGRKRWIFYPPGVTPPGVHPSADGDQVALPLSVGEWIFQFWDEHVERTRSSPISERPVECTALPGDVCFVPHGWWHMVINLDEINIAITHNYVSTRNLDNVLRFFDEKECQISGCRDREESVKPKDLRRVFVAALQETRPKELESALQVKDWTCRAWSNNSSLANKKISNEDDKFATEKDCMPTAKKSKNLMDVAKTTNGQLFSFSFL